MKNKPVLVIMAAGMGSRYGGLKQMDPIGPCGEIIIDYSLYDARKAGFETAVCIIKRSIENDFKDIMNRGAAKHMNIEYAYQEMEAIPEGFEIPKDRVKPWGTAHAILAAKGNIDGSFAVINADDYYGPGAFKSMYDYLVNAQDGEKYDFCMAGYRIENTLTDHGAVARGICVEKGGYLARIDERTRVQRNNGSIQFTEDDGQSWTDIADGTLVSMNFFGYTKSIMKELEERFPAALEKILASNPIKGEYLIPSVTSDLINDGAASVRVIPCHEKWFGVTYKEDRALVVAAMKEKTERGEYPADLWK